MFEKLKIISELIIEFSIINKKGKYEFIIKVLEELRDAIESCKPKVKKLADVAPKFDFNDTTPGNGLRSFVETFDAAIINIYWECLMVKKSRRKLFFSLEDFIR